MKELITSLTKTGQASVPAEVRKRLGIEGKVAWVLADDGTVRVRRPKYQRVAELAGVAGKLPHPLGWKEMREVAYRDRFQPHP